MTDDARALPVTRSVDPFPEGKRSMVTYRVKCKCGAFCAHDVHEREHEDDLAAGRAGDRLSYLEKRMRKDHCQRVTGTGGCYE